MYDIFSYLESVGNSFHVFNQKHVFQQYEIWIQNNAYVWYFLSQCVVLLQGNLIRLLLNMEVVPILTMVQRVCN